MFNWINYIYAVIFLGVLLYSSCDKNDICHCRDLEECIDGECVLKEGAYYLSGFGFEQSDYNNNLFLGFVNHSDCLDTILFNPVPYGVVGDTYQFDMYTSTHQPYNYLQLTGAKLNDSTYSTYGGTACFLNGYEYFTNFKFTNHADSITGTFLLWVLGEPTLKDTSDITLFRL